MKSKVWSIFFLIICLVVIGLFLDDIMFTYTASVRSSEGIKSYKEQFTFCKDEYAQNNFNDELVNYLSEALSTGMLPQSLLSIVAEHEELDMMDKVKIIKNSKNNVLADYQCCCGSMNDTWYRVSLQAGEDIVISHIDEEGNNINYFFENCGALGHSYELAFRSGGQKNSEPYFIKWNDKNYLVTLHTKEDHITGIIIYDYTSFAVLSIGKDREQNINLCYQICDAGSYEGTYWPIVLD